MNSNFSQTSYEFYTSFNSMNRRVDNIYNSIISASMLELSDILCWWM